MERYVWHDREGDISLGNGMGFLLILRKKTKTNKNPLDHVSVHATNQLQ